MMYHFYTRQIYIVSYSGDNALEESDAAAKVPVEIIFMSDFLNCIENYLKNVPEA